MKRIVNPTTFDGIHPTAGGLYDPALGPIDQKDRCTTCSLLGAHCPGHVGHIELPYPVFHPLFFMRMFHLLRITCRYCHKLTVSRSIKALAVAQLKLLDFDLLIQSKDMENIFESYDTSNGGDDGKEKRTITATEWEVVIQQRMQKLLADAGIDPNATPNYRACKTRNTEEYRREVVQNFLRACSRLSKGSACPNCGGIRRRLSHVNHVRIVLAPLSKRDKELMATKGLFEHSIFDDKKLQSGIVNGVVSSGGGNDSTEDNSNSEENEESNSEESDTDSESGYENDPNKENKKEEHTNAKHVHDSSSRPFLSALEVREDLKDLWLNEIDILSLIFRELVFQGDQRQTMGLCSSQDIFFIQVLPVPPSRFRPASKLGDKTFENPLTTMLQKVLTACKDLSDISAILKDSNPGTPEHVRAAKRHSEALQLLQQHVNVLMDSSLDTNTNNKDIVRGIRQTLERKEGLFRMHMMGKRVNFAARSVISPDPMIGTHEIGVPEVFALRLTFPEPVTTWNVAYLRNLVLNGPQVHPGATHVEDEFGNLRELSGDLAQREAIADQLLTPQGDSLMAKKVLRHIRSGDWVLVNRQPTLHKSSIMAHQVRVLRGERTLRLHYANCKTYNADFDGDEMNMHFPQNEVARAEASMIACTDNQYCALDGSPLRGLIQDHIVAGFKLTSRGTLMDRDMYQQLVYSCLHDSYDGKPVKTVPPCILKPRPMWSGKQVITTVLMNITGGMVGLNLKSSAKVRNSWSADYQDLEGEGQVIYRDGELLVGVIDKNQCGATAGGLVHACYEIYGGRVASEVLSTFGRLFTAYLKYSSISLAVDDLLLTPAAESSRRKLIEAAANAGANAAIDVLQLDTAGLSEEEKMDVLHSSLENALREPGRAAGEFHIHIYLYIWI